MFYLSESYSVVVNMRIVVVASGRVAGIGDVSDIVRMSRSVGVGNREPMKHLGDGVGFSLCISFGIMCVCDAGISGSDAVGESSVTKNFIASDCVTTVVNTRDDPVIVQTPGHLAQGVGIGLGLSLH